MYALDIETVPQQAALAAPYVEADHAPPSNYKSDEAIAGWHTRNEAKWRADRAKECALSPLDGRICAVSIVSPDREVVLVAMTEDKEVEVLREVWDLLMDGRTVATFNGASFDLPYLFVRSALHGLRPSLSGEYLRKYGGDRHFDVRMVLANYERFGRGTLDQWCDAFKVIDPDPELVGLSGADVSGMVERGDTALLVRYGYRDAKRTYDLADRLLPIYW